MIRWPEINHNPKEGFAVHMQVGRFHTSWHHHPKHQLVYAEEAVLHVHTGSQHLILPAAHGAWIPGRQTHRIYSNSPALNLHNLYFDEQQCEPSRLQQFHIFPISTLAREMILFTRSWEAEGETGEMERSFMETLRHLAIEWCHQTIPLVLPTTDHELLGKVTGTITANLGAPLALTGLAREHNLSARTLARLFKSQLGMTFGTYLRMARMIRAIERLNLPNATVTDVAFSVGYSSLSSFSQTFQQLTGTKPSDYLRKRS